MLFMIQISRLEEKKAEERRSTERRHSERHPADHVGHRDISHIYCLRRVPPATEFECSLDVGRDEHMPDGRVEETQATGGGEGANENMLHSDSPVRHLQKQDIIIIIEPD